MGEEKEKPKCYGKYWDRAPTVRNLKERDCLDCPWWTLDEGGCPTKNMPKLVGCSESPYCKKVVQKGKAGPCVGCQNERIQKNIERD